MTVTRSTHCLTASPASCGAVRFRPRPPGAPIGSPRRQRPCTPSSVSPLSPAHHDRLPPAVHGGAMATTASPSPRATIAMPPPHARQPSWRRWRAIRSGSPQGAADTPGCQRDHRGNKTLPTRVGRAARRLRAKTEWFTATRRPRDAAPCRHAGSVDAHDGIDSQTVRESRQQWWWIAHRASRRLIANGTRHGCPASHPPGKHSRQHGRRHHRRLRDCFPVGYAIKLSASPPASPPAFTTGVYNRSSAILTGKRLRSASM